MTIDSIIFDLDGTLWDATDMVVKGWNKALEEYGQEHRLSIEPLTKEQVRKVMGLQIDEIARRFFPQLSEEGRKVLMDKGCEIECRYLLEDGGKPYPYVLETLALLARKYKLFIVSNCQAGYIETFLAAHQLEHYFADFENPGRTGLSKAENIKMVIERNNLQSPVYLGDTTGDGRAAHQAGIPFIYARYGFGDVEEYDAVIDSFQALPEVIEQW